MTSERVRLMPRRLPTLYFVPSPGRFRAGQTTSVREATLDHLRCFVRIEPLAWVIA